ncbi:MAG: phytanoyl-CoA dioxygenase family protein [Rhodospirillaceae bacterium]
MLTRLKRLFTRTPPPVALGAYHSNFGGLWIDRKNASLELTRRALIEEVLPITRQAVAHFMSKGYAILPRAVPEAVANDLTEVITAAYAEGDSRLRYHTDGAEHHLLEAGTDPKGKSLVEAHAVLPEVRRALSAPAILEFLSTIFDETPVLTQSLIFQTGSEQGFHQDPAFVVYDKPLSMAACWVALEDIKVGSGELRYLVNSHRLPDYVFSNGRRDSHGTSPAEVESFLAWLITQAQQRGFKQETFLAKKGDVLIWHADLVHGDCQVTDHEATRRSLVGHFCPASVYPQYEGAKNRRQDGDLTYSNYIYNFNNPADPSNRAR